MLTNGQVYDYNINDQFHYYQAGQDVTPNATRFTIIDKYYSASNDTVFYIRHFDNYVTHINSIPTLHLEYFFDKYNDTLNITNLDSLISSQFNNWPIHDTMGNWFMDTSYISAQWCDILTYEYSGCIGCAFEGNSYQGQYGQGIGLIKEIHSCPAWPQIDYQYYLKYYKKDTISCGTPDLTTVGVKNPLREEPDFFFYPNPAKEYIFLKNKSSHNKYQCFIINTLGQTMMTMNLNGELNVINLHNLNPGIYFLKINAEKRTTTLKLSKE